MVVFEKKSEIFPMEITLDNKLVLGVDKELNFLISKTDIIV